MNSFQHVDSTPYYSKESRIESTPPWGKKSPSLQWTGQDETGRESILKKHALKLKKRRESISTTQNRPLSIDIIPRLTKSSVLQTNKQIDDPQWDPHIDAFDILRAKLNGITRSMQELHTNAHSCRFDSANNRPEAYVSQGRIHSYGPEPPDDDDQEDDSLSPSYSEEEQRAVTSPNLTALFVTTNNLIHSKLDELSETTSIHSEHEDRSAFEWRHQFLNLVTLCIHQSEALESLSVDILNAEQRVRELMFLNQSIHDQFHDQEKQYEERIRECREVAKQQLLMIDSLEELTVDINMKLDSTHKDEDTTHPDETMRGLPGEDEEGQDSAAERWDFSQAVSDLLNMEEKLDHVYQIRWDVGMFVGGGVNTGHVIHSFEDRLRGIDLMIAGSGATNNSLHEEVVEEEEMPVEEESNFISPTIRHIKFHQNQYVLHLTDRDKQVRFVLLPKTLWVPDEHTDLCQFPSCSSRFSLFVRRHHCRRCGQIVCQKHSSNQLPLFSSITQFQWSRVCDACFQDLIIMQTK
ncbi:unnamed protein product [Rhizopus stolonifer]